MFGLKPADRVVLQPTRVIRRKGIEHAIELVKALDNHDYKLVISHEAGDEGYEYAQEIYAHDAANGVELRLPRKSIHSPWLHAGMNGVMTAHTVAAVKQILKSPERRANMVNRNYEIACRHYSYSSLEKRLSSLIHNAFNASMRSAPEDREACRLGRSQTLKCLELSKGAVRHATG